MRCKALGSEPDPRSPSIHLRHHRPPLPTGDRKFSSFLPASPSPSQSVCHPLSPSPKEQLCDSRRASRKKPPATASHLRHLWTARPLLQPTISTLVSVPESSLRQLFQNTPHPCPAEHTPWPGHAEVLHPISPLWSSIGDTSQGCRGSVCHESAPALKGLVS